jgi:hypothetical protein
MSDAERSSPERPPTIPPDTKDWTWVLERTCPECGFGTADISRDEVGAMLRDNARSWHALLSGGPRVRHRARPDHWSILEYGCHVRDVCRQYLQRLDLMLEQDGPHYPNWDQDATAVEQRYDLADPASVATELVEAAEALATRFDEVTDDQWERTGYRSDGARFTIESFARYFIHDPVHHLADVS